MKIAIVHYHLKRGGVTRVIETALDGLRASGNEVMNLRIDDLQRQCIRQRRHPAVATPVNANLKAVLAVPDTELSA